MAGLRPFWHAASAVLLAGCSANVPAREQVYREQQAKNLVAEYQQVRLRGDLLGMCVKSNQIAAAYVDAKDLGNAGAWRSRNADDCRAAREALMPDAGR